MGLEDQYMMDNDLVRPDMHTEAKSCSQPSQPSAFGQVYMSYNFCTNSSYTLAVSASTRPGVRREPGIFGRKLSVGATLDIGR